MLHPGRCVCRWENVVSNTRELQRAAWRAVAEAEGLPFPAMDRPQLYDLRPERAAMDVSALPRRRLAAAGLPARLACRCCAAAWLTRMPPLLACLPGDGAAGVLLLA